MAEAFNLVASTSSCTSSDSLVIGRSLWRATPLSLPFKRCRGRSSSSTSEEWRPTYTSWTTSCVTLNSSAARQQPPSLSATLDYLNSGTAIARSLPSCSITWPTWWVTWSAWFKSFSRKQCASIPSPSDSLVCWCSPIEAFQGLSEIVMWQLTGRQRSRSPRNGGSRSSNIYTRASSFASRLARCVATKVI